MNEDQLHHEDEPEGSKTPFLGEESGEATNRAYCKRLRLDSVDAIAVPNL